MKKVLKIFKPITPSLRITKLLNQTDLIRNIKPIKCLTKGYKRSYGRNNQGIKTNWNKGGGHKRLYRQIDFCHTTNPFKTGILEGFEYDPNRNTKIIRIFNPDYHYHFYTLSIKNIIPYQILKSLSRNNIGERLFLKDLAAGSLISNLSVGINNKGKYLRSAGAYGQIISKNNEFVRIKLISGEHRIFPEISIATLGSIGNENYRFIKLGKAGRNRWYGKKPIVRGVAINPVDHPHGGGEGKTSGGRPSVTPWGKPTKNQRLLKRVNKIQVQLK